MTTDADISRDDGLESASFTGSIDSVLGRLLYWKYPKWRKKTLYSWCWGLGNGYLEPKAVYDLRRFNVETFNLSHIDSDSAPIDVVKTYERERRTLFGRKKDVILELLITGVDIGRTYHFVVTNMRPDTDMFSKEKLYSGIGKWDAQYR